MFRCALSFVFPDEQNWAREMWKESDGPAHIAYCGRPLVTCFRDAKTVSRFVEHGPHYELLAHAVDAMGPGAFVPLKKLFTFHGHDAKQQRAIVSAMALIESSQVAKFLAPLAKDKKIGGVVESYFTRRPDLFAFARS